MLFYEYSHFSSAGIADYVRTIVYEAVIEEADNDDVPHPSEMLPCFYPWISANS